MPGYLSAAQLASMRATTLAFCPESGHSIRTDLTFPCEVEPDQREHHLPGAASIVRMRRWVMTVPYATDIARYDTIFVPTLAVPAGGPGPGYWVAEAKQPASYDTEYTLLTWQIYEADGTPVDPVTENCSVKLLRAGVQIGDVRRARFMPATPGSLHPMGEWLPDTLFVSYLQTDWRMNDVVEITALDGFGDLPHPHRWRCKTPRLVSEPPSYITIELLGEAGGFEG